MDADEKDVCAFLKSFPGEFVGLKEICRRAGGKWRYREKDDWAVPVLRRLVEKGFVEEDSAGHFRLVAVEKKQASKKKPAKWVAPHIREILERSGKTFDINDEAENP
jgi:hypothetical protein